MILFFTIPKSYYFFQKLPIPTCINVYKASQNYSFTQT